MAWGFGIGFRQWATQDLRSGDMTALSAVAAGSKADAMRVQRLSRRGFVAQRANGRVVITQRGRMALFVHRLMRA